MILLLAACGGPDSEKDAGASDAQTCGNDLDLPAETPSWEEVAPILGEHCSQCHNTEGIAPFPLVDAESAATYAASIKYAVTARTMPPFLPSTCGDCQTWRDSNQLSDEEIAILAAWADGGAPTGDAEVPIEDPPGLDRVDATVDIGAEYTPDAAVDDDYRCFLVDSGEVGSYLTGFDIHPGDQRVVHHVIIYQPTDEGAVSAAESLDAADDGPGYSCFSGAMVDADTLGGWAPGGGAVTLPEGTGIPLTSEKLILQLHYNLANGAWPDLTSADLRIDANVDYPGSFYTLKQTDLALEPGRSAITRSASVEVPAEARVWGLISHMHARGVSTGVTRTRDGEETCMLDVPRWDFNWQAFWFYEEPVDVAPGDVVTLSCTFDTSGDSEVVDWGESTADEMCVAFAFVTR